MIKRITSSKGIVTAVWVLGLVVIWEICAFIVGATQRTPVNVLPHLYQIIGSFFDTKSITGSGDTIATLVFSSAAETLSRALIGFIIGMVLGYILALLMHLSHIVEKIAFPYLTKKRLVLRKFGYRLNVSDSTDTPKLKPVLKTRKDETL